MLKTAARIAITVLAFSAPCALPRGVNAQSSASTTTQRRVLLQQGLVAGAPLKGVDIKLGREAAPGVFVIQPDAVKGKRLIVPRTDIASGKIKGICIGSYSPKDGCSGIWISFE